MTLDVAALEKLVTSSGLSFRQNGVSWIFECPRCNKKDKLYLRKRDGQFVCWYCQSLNGFRGKPEFALKELLSVPLSNVREKLYGVSFESVTGAELDTIELVDFFGEEDEIPGDISPVAAVAFPFDFLDIDDPKAIKGLLYLTLKRGISLEVAKEIGIKYHPEDHRVIFPIVVGGRLVGWQARTIDQEKGVTEEGVEWKIDKILTSPRSLERDRVCMFADSLDSSDHVIVCEGPVDAIKCHMVGGAVATMGKTVSPGQIDLIRLKMRRLTEKGFRPRLYLGLDPDAAGELNRLCRILAEDFQVYQLLPMPGYKDLGEMSFDQVRRQVLSAQRINTGNLFPSVLVDRFAQKSA